jgi:hypothetical protein
MGIVEVTLSRWAPSMGNGGGGLEISSVPYPTGSNSPIRVDAIRFGSVDFTKHSPVHSPTFGCINGIIDLAFGDFNCRATRTGILRLHDSFRHTRTRTNESENLVGWMNEENKIGFEPDSAIPTHPHLYFVAMAKRIPRDNTDDEKGEEPPPKPWGETDPEGFNDGP